MTAPLRPSATMPPRRQWLLTRSQIQRKSDTANAEQACENPGAMYM